MHLKPSDIYFSQDSINNRFDKNSRHSGTFIGETLDDICEGRCSYHDLPRITVVKRGGKWVTHDNRRLWVFRHLERLDICDEISVHVSNYIPSSKLTSENGGNDINVRRNPGGRWYLKRSKNKKRRDTRLISSLATDIKDSKLPARALENISNYQYSSERNSVAHTKEAFVKLTNQDYGPLRSVVSDTRKNPTLSTVVLSNNRFNKLQPEPENDHGLYGSTTLRFESEINPGVYESKQLQPESGDKLGLYGGTKLQPEPAICLGLHGITPLLPDSERKSGFYGETTPQPELKDKHELYDRTPLQPESETNKGLYEETIRKFENEVNTDGHERKTAQPTSAVTHMSRQNSQNTGIRVKTKVTEPAHALVPPQREPRTGSMLSTSYSPQEQTNSIIEMHDRYITQDIDTEIKRQNTQRNTSHCCCIII